MDTAYPEPTPLMFATLVSPSIMQLFARSSTVSRRRKATPCGSFALTHRRRWPTGAFTCKLHQQQVTKPRRIFVGSSSLSGTLSSHFRQRQDTPFMAKLYFDGGEYNLSLQRVWKPVKLAK